MSKRRNQKKKRQVSPKTSSPEQSQETLAVAEPDADAGRRPKDELAAAARRLSLSVQSTQSFSGPLPPPETLLRYNEAIPNGAERIVAMAEKQAAHRIELESHVVKADIWRSYLGVGTGLIVALAFLAVSYLLIDGGHEIGGTVLGTVDIVSLVSVFVYGTISRRREREQRSREMTGQP